MNLPVKSAIQPVPGIRKSTMAAAAIVAPRRVEIVQVPVPEPGPTELRVRLEGCGVCASNIPPWEGRPWFQYPMGPGAPGHEGWGFVDAVGCGVTQFAVGDRVAILSSHAYAQYDLAEEAAAIRLPAQFDGAPFPGEPLGCAMNILARTGIEPGDRVAVVGIGFLGALLTQLASNLGARVIAISRRQDSLLLAESFGAWKSIVFTDTQGVVGAVRKLTGPQLCRVAIEATGKQAPLELSAELVSERGRLVIAGYHQDGARRVNVQLWNWRGLDVINAHERDPGVYLHGMRSALAEMQSGRISPERLYSHRFPLERLGEALEMAAQRPPGFMKALILV